VRPLRERWRSGAGEHPLKQTDGARERYENYGKDDEDDEVKADSDEEKPKKVKRR